MNKDADAVVLDWAKGYAPLSHETEGFNDLQTMLLAAIDWAYRDAVKTLLKRDYDDTVLDCVSAIEERLK